MSWSSGFKPEHEESKGKGGESAGLRWFKAPCIFSIWRTSLVTESMAHWGVKEAICSLPLDRLQNQLTSRRQENKIHLNRSFNLVSFIFVLKKKKSQADFFSAIILTELITPQGVWNSTSESVWIRFFQLNIHPSIHPSIHPFSLPACRVPAVIGREAGTPGQVASPSQGHTETNETNKHTHAQTHS